LVAKIHFLLSRLLVSACICVIAGCGSSDVQKPSSSDRLVLEKIKFSDISGWKEDNHPEAFASFLKSCGAFAKQKDSDAIGKGYFLAPIATWKTICRKASIVPPTDALAARSFFEEEFVPMRASNNDNSQGFITGYYEATLNGSRTKQSPYIYPIYKLPDELLRNYTRSQIDLGMLEGLVSPIAYVDDPVQLFFMHIQGSGQIKLDSGENIHVTYAGNNGYDYVSIGKVLADKGIMQRKDITMQSLRRWLYDHPNDMWQVLWENPTYIFFREAGDAVVGSGQAALTPMRSLAVDTKYIPLGMPIFINTMFSDNGDAPPVIQRKLMIAQDTGRAIRGPIRADIFFGSGISAEKIAGRLKSGGEFILLVPRSIGELIKLD